MSSLQEVAEVIAGSARVLICGHIVPDGDSLGSVAALGLTLEGMGKKVVMGSPDPIPEALMFLPGTDKFVIGCDNLRHEDYDTFVVLDCSVPKRLGSFRKFLEKDLMIVNIDHHVSSESFAHYNYLDAGAAATGEIMTDLIDLMGTGINKDVATCLYVAMVTDTGSFQYENTSSGTLRKAARLMDAGIQSPSINVRLYEERPIQNIQMMGAVLEKLEISPCGRVAWSVVERDLLDRFSAKDEHTDGLINFLRTIKGVEVAMLFREIEKGKFKIGFRSKGEVDVNRLASKFGGGGHVRASGCILTGNLQKITQAVVGEAVKEVSARSS
ncbi:MAG: phosphoesterase [Peptococcaceae bacterium BRH_c4a]|nr:MAG: phosphoesterase [Peptococcaceae bacterium BRH_c4a]